MVLAAFCAAMTASPRFNSHAMAARMPDILFIQLKRVTRFLPHLQKIVHWTCFGPVDIHLVHQHPLETFVLCKLLDFLIGARLLRQKLIAAYRHICTIVWSWRGFKLNYCLHCIGRYTSCAPRKCDNGKAFASKSLLKSRKILKNTTKLLTRNHDEHH